MTNAPITRVLNFPCSRCPCIRQVSVEAEQSTVIIPRTCPMRQACEAEVLRAYYTQKSDAPFC